MNSRKTSLMDVVKASGISYTTVSRSLGNGNSTMVRPETVERVRKVAKQLGYRPNAAARALSSRRVPYIGVLFGSSQNSPEQIPTSGLVRGHADLLVELGICLEDIGYHLILATPNPVALQEPSESPGLPRMLEERHVSGVLVINHIWAELYQEVTRYQIPCVGVISEELPEIPIVESDYTISASQCTQHLIDLGHRRIALLASAWKTVKSDNMNLGYLGTMGKAGLTPSPGWDRYVDSSQILAGLLDSSEPPTAVLVYDNFEAANVVEFLKSKSLSVPDDISVVSLQDVGWSEIQRPSLTTSTINFKQVANRAVGKVMALINDESVPSLCEKIAPELVVRGSSGPCKQ